MELAQKLTKEMIDVKCRSVSDAEHPALHRLISAAIARETTLETGVLR